MSRSWGVVQPRKCPRTDGRSMTMAAMQKQSDERLSQNTIWIPDPSKVTGLSGA